MQSSIRSIDGALARLGHAVEAMGRATVLCRRNLMVFRARMEAAEDKVASIQQTLGQAMALLEEAEAGTRRAADIFRSTAAGRSAG